MKKSEKGATEGGEYQVPRRATVAELVKVLRELEQPLSEVMIRRHIKKAGLKKGPKDGKFHVSAVLDAIAIAREKDNKKIPESSAKAEKIRLEVDILRLKRDQILGTVVPIEEHLSTLQQLARIQLRGFEEFREYVTVETKNPALLSRLEAIDDRVRADITARVEAEAEED